VIETVVWSDELSPADVAAVLQIAAAAEASDGVAPLSEQILLRLGNASPGVRHLLAYRGPAPDGHETEPGVEGLIGYAQLDAESTAELVVDPAQRRQGVGSALLTELERVAGSGALNIWAHGELAGASALARRQGYLRSRVLLQLRRSLDEPLPAPHFPADVTVRTFVPGADEAPWLSVNNAAFASHPEQGRWSLVDVQQRESQSWFDPAGLFLAERGHELVGFHWTKVHQDVTPPIGEVYVVGVRPQDAGHGLGPALTLVGLHHLRSLGLKQVLLYVDEDNRPAMKTYERLGFTRWATDVRYARP
jgi:mycothiol synthase